MFQQQRFEKEYPSHETFLVAHREVIAGFIVLKCGSEEIHLSLLLLRPKFQSLGIGTRVTRFWILDFGFWISSVLKGRSLKSVEIKEIFPLERGGLKPLFLVMELVLAQAKSFKVSVALSCFRQNYQALKFYDRLGFQTTYEDTHFAFLTIAP